MFRKDYQKYKWGYDGLRLLIGGAILIFVSVFIKSVLFHIFDFIKITSFDQLGKILSNSDKLSAFISLAVSIIILFSSFFQWWNITYDGEMKTKNQVKILFIISILFLIISFYLILV